MSKLPRVSSLSPTHASLLHSTPLPSHSLLFPPTISLFTGQTDGTDADTETVDIPVPAAPKKRAQATKPVHHNVEHVYYFVLCLDSTNSLSSYQTFRLGI